MALCGATCVIVPEQIVWLPRFLAQFMAAQRITAWYCVPSVLSGLLAERTFVQGRFPDLRLAIFAGEVLPGRDVAKLRTVVPSAAVYNLYGPTETNVVTWYRVPEDFAPSRPVPIGSACPYAELMLDPDSVEKGDGEESGDLLVAGDSLMLGYWNDPGETAKAFMDTAADGTSFRRFYRTGDRVVSRSCCRPLYLCRQERPAGETAGVPGRIGRNRECSEDTCRHSGSSRDCDAR